MKNLQNIFSIFAICLIAFGCSSSKTVKEQNTVQEVAPKQEINIFTEAYVDGRVEQIKEIDRQLSEAKRLNKPVLTADLNNVRLKLQRENRNLLFKLQKEAIATEDKSQLYLVVDLGATLAEESFLISAKHSDDVIQKRFREYNDFFIKADNLLADIEAAEKFVEGANEKINAAKSVDELKALYDSLKDTHAKVWMLKDEINATVRGKEKVFTIVAVAGLKKEVLADMISLKKAILDKRDELKASATQEPAPENTAEEAPVLEPSDEEAEEAEIINELDSDSEATEEVEFEDENQSSEDKQASVIDNEAASFNTAEILFRGLASIKNQASFESQLAHLDRLAKDLKDEKYKSFLQNLAAVSGEYKKTIQLIDAVGSAIKQLEAAVVKIAVQERPANHNGLYTDIVAEKSTIDAGIRELAAHLEKITSGFEIFDEARKFPESARFAVSETMLLAEYFNAVWTLSSNYDQARLAIAGYEAELQRAAVSRDFDYSKLSQAQEASEAGIVAFTKAIANAKRVVAELSGAKGERFQKRHSDLSSMVKSANSMLDTLNDAFAELTQQKLDLGLNFVSHDANDSNASLFGSLVLWIALIVIFCFFVIKLLGKKIAGRFVKDDEIPVEVTEENSDASEEKPSEEAPVEKEAENAGLTAEISAQIEKFHGKMVTEISGIVAEFSALKKYSAKNKVTKKTVLSSEDVDKMNGYLDTVKAASLSELESFKVCFAAINQISGIVDGVQVKRYSSIKNTAKGKLSCLNNSLLELSDKAGVGLREARQERLDKRRKEKAEAKS